MIFITASAVKELFLSASVAATAIFFIILTIIIYYASFILILLNCFMSPAITFLNITVKILNKIYTYNFFIKLIINIYFYFVLGNLFNNNIRIFNKSHCSYCLRKLLQQLGQE